MSARTFSVAAALMLLALALPSAAGAPMDLDVTLAFSNLAPLGSEHYEGWLIVGGTPVSTGPFQVSADGHLEDLMGHPTNVFHIGAVDLEKATGFVVSIEPSGDSDPAPAAVKPLAGDLNAAMSAAALKPNLAGKSLATIGGAYVLATPSDGPDTNERSGLWFLAFYGSDPPVAGLAVPDLNGTDWVYEGWVVIGGKPLSTGKFEKPVGADAARPYSAAGDTPPYPGEDFLMNAPAGLSFPTDLRGAKVVVSVEPRIDSDPGPFQFKPLVADVPATAADHTVFNLTDANGTLPFGSVTIGTMAPSAGSGALGTDMLYIVGAAVSAAVIVSALLLLRRKAKAP